jgi:hypothetical protein
VPRDRHGDFGFKIIGALQYDKANDNNNGEFCKTISNGVMFILSHIYSLTYHARPCNGTRLVVRSEYYIMCFRGNSLQAYSDESVHIR